MRYNSVRSFKPKPNINIILIEGFYGFDWLKDTKLGLPNGIPDIAVLLSSPGETFERVWVNAGYDRRELGPEKSKELFGYHDDFGYWMRKLNWDITLPSEDPLRWDKLEQYLKGRKEKLKRKQRLSTPLPLELTLETLTSDASLQLGSILQPGRLASNNEFVSPVENKISSAAPQTLTH